MSNQVSQVPINNTYQVYVPPGDQTGLYYILLANLPWQTSWQQLKDHVRTVCSVERVEIFNESTSGWVMVRGREDFDRAYKLLSERLFNGRPIFADDRNATEPTAIKILAGSALPEAASRTPRAPAYTAASPPPSLVSCTTASSSLPAPTLADYGQMWTATPPYSAITSPSVSCYATNAVPATMEYDYGENRHWYAEPGPPMGAYLEGGGYPYPQAYATAAGGCDEATASRGGEQLPRPDRGSAGGFVETEKRKIIIKGLPDWTQYQHVHELVRAAAGPDQAASHISLPASRHAGGGPSRGYAIVTFRHPEAAEAAIRQLHNYDFEGRRLTVKHTKEGVSESEDSRGKSSGAATQHHHHHHHHHHHSKKGHHHAGGSGHTSSGGGGGSSSKHRREDREKRDGHAKGAHDRKDKKDKAPPPPPSSSSFSSSKRGVVIADGSTKRPSESGSGGERRKPG